MRPERVNKWSNCMTYDDDDDVGGWLVNTVMHCVMTSTADRIKDGSPII
jgi:hypothetical protein